MRSLHVIASPHLGGAETAFMRITAALEAAGHPSLRLVRRGSELHRRLGGQVLTQALRNYVDLSSVLGIRRAIRDTGVEVVQTWMSRATWLTRAPRGCLHVARIGGYYKPGYFRHAQAWVVNTRGLHDWLLREGFPSRRLERIYNFVPELSAAAPRYTRAQFGIPEDAFVVATMGRFVEKKGFQDLIAACAALPARLGRRPLHLLAMGSGPLLEPLRASELGARAHLPGWVEEPVAALDLAEVFVCPSREEAFGNVIVEAWSRGLPVLSTRTDGGRELIDDGVNGLLCAVADPADLARQLRRLMGSAGLRSELGARGRAHYHEHFSEQRTVDAYLDFYRRMRGSAR